MATIQDKQKSHVALDRKDSLVGNCWWISACIHERKHRDVLFLISSICNSFAEKQRNLSAREYIDLKLKPYTVEVSEDEARTGKGRACPVCGRGNGSYVCDGFPTFQASVALREEKERRKGEGDGS